MTRWRDKDPDATVPYGLDLADYLEEFAPGDSLATASWSATPAGDGHLTIGDASIDGTSVSGWFSAGVAGTNYLVTLHFTTAGGLTDEISQPLFVVNA